MVVMLIMTNSSSFWLTSSSSVRIDVAFTAALSRPIDDMPVLPKPSVKNTFLNFDVESFPCSVRTRCQTLPAVLRENNVLKQQPRISNKIESHFTLRRADGVQLGVEWLADFDQSLSVLRPSMPCFLVLGRFVFTPVMSITSCLRLAISSLPSVLIRGLTQLTRFCPR